MKWYNEPLTGERRYVMIGKRTYYAEWDGTKWNKLSWPKKG